MAVIKIVFVLMFGDIYKIKRKKNIPLFKVPYLIAHTSQNHDMSDWLCFPWWKLVEEVSNFGGLAVAHQAKRVWSRPHPKPHAKSPDLCSRCRAIMQSPTPDKVQRWGAHQSNSDWKQLPGSGKHLIICDAKQLKTHHLLLTYRTDMTGATINASLCDDNMF